MLIVDVLLQAEDVGEAGDGDQGDNTETHNEGVADDNGEDPAGPPDGGDNAQHAAEGDQDPGV
jgi:hypothetical protein